MGILRKFISRQNPNGNSSASPESAYNHIRFVRARNADDVAGMRAAIASEKDAVRRLFEYQANSCGGLSESAEVRSLSEFPEEEEV